MTCTYRSETGAGTITSKKNLDMKMIVLQNKEAREKIRRELGITGAALSYALNFKRNSPTAVKARTMALQNGGVLMEEVKSVRPVKVLDAKGNVIKILEE